MGLIKRFEDLKVWQEARALTVQAYAIARGKAFVRDPSLAEQLRRSAVSTMNNIAEGFDSASRTEFRRFLRYAARSASEVQSCLYVALDQNYVTSAKFQATYDQAASVRRLGSGLIGRLEVTRDSPAHRRTGAPAHGGRRREGQ